MLFIRLFCAAIVAAFSLVAFGSLLGLCETTILLATFFSVSNFIMTALEVQF